MRHAGRGGATSAWTLSIVMFTFVTDVANAQVSCVGDVDGSAVVDSLDLAQVVSSWGTCPGCIEDLNGDRFVDILDLVIVVMNWGSCLSDSIIMLPPR